MERLFMFLYICMQKALVQVLAFSRYPFSTAHVVIRIFKTLLCFLQLLIASQQLTSRCQVHYYFYTLQTKCQLKDPSHVSLFPKMYCLANLQKAHKSRTQPSGFGSNPICHYKPHPVHKHIMILHHQL